MTTMTEARQEEARATVRRPASGIAIDPGKLRFYRERLALSRQDVSDRITRLFLAGDPDALPFFHTYPAEPYHDPVPVPGPAPQACQVCGGAVTGGLTPDGLAKNEKGDRRPKPRTVRALCKALSDPDQIVRPQDLMPGGAALPLPAEAQERQDRLDRNDDMREFALALGREDLFRNASGRIFYRKELRDLYAQFQASQEAAGEPDELAS